MISSSPRPMLSSRARTLRIKLGMRLSASVIARPHMGSAGQAMLSRVRGSMASMGRMPCCSSRASTSPLCAAGTSLKIRLCAQSSLDLRASRDIDDAPLLDVEAVEPEAVSLLVPAHPVAVLPGHHLSPGRHRSAHVALNQRPEPVDAQGVH
eukprot:16036-Heterococcus_DN1.PRE.1